MDGEDTTNTNTPSSTSPRFFYHHHHPNVNVNVNVNPFSSSARTPTFPPPTPTPPAAASALSPPAPSEPVKKKRGRPRKYGIGAAAAAAAAAAASASSLASSSSVKKLQSGGGSQLQLPFSRSPAAAAVAGNSSSPSEKKKKDASGRGQGFTPHVITVNNGEDVAQKIAQFTQQTKRAICILSASGSISSASLRQTAAYGGQITIEGRYEITSLCGSFLPENAGVSRTGGLSVCLSGLDIGSLVGGGVSGPLIAAGLVTVIAGSFTVDTTDLESSTVKPGEAVPTNQGSTLVTPVAFRPNIGSNERISGAEVGDDQPGTGVSDFFMQPNLISMNFMSHQWRGLEGPSRASRSNEEDIKSDGS